MPGRPSGWLAMATPELVVVHPLVLLSVVDHYNRAAKDTRKRVLGLLLGESHKGRVDITNSFAGECRCQSPTILTRAFSDGIWPVRRGA